jgi:hypothetical protein
MRFDKRKLFLVAAQMRLPPPQALHLRTIPPANSELSPAIGL